MANAFAYFFRIEAMFPDEFQSFTEEIVMDILYDFQINLLINPRVHDFPLGRG